MFYGKSYVFNSQSSLKYNLQIVNFSSSVQESDAGTSATAIEQRLPRRAKSYILGVTKNEPLKITLEVAKLDEKPIYTNERNLIMKWMMKKQYCNLVIVQDDMTQIVYTVLFNNAQNKFIGNVQHGITFTGVCNSPFAYSPNRTFTYTNSGSGTVNVNTSIFCDSNDDDYVYPTSMVVTLNNIGSSVSIVNSSDASRTFSASALQANEVLTINNDLKTITSSTGLLRIDNFNKKWFRLKPGQNSLNIQGGVKSITITYTAPKAAGG